MTTGRAALDLLDYRRRTAELYALARDRSRSEPGRSRAFRAGKDELFATHPASPLDVEQRRRFRGLAYSAYDPRWRTTARAEPVDDDEGLDLDLGADGTVRLTRALHLHATIDGTPLRLTAFWIGGYGGGLFVPFRDATSGRWSYGGGRYLIDTIKHADLGSDDGRLVLDFNYAYAPSCAYHDRWTCPLSPTENALNVRVPVGEALWSG